MDTMDIPSIKEAHDCCSGNSEVQADTHYMYSNSANIKILYKVSCLTIRFADNVIHSG